MSVSNVEETLPNQPVLAKNKRRSRFLWILIGVLAFVLLVAAGAYSGYQEAIRERLAKQSSQLAMDTTTQF
jgi:flagellar basal body-associated protein FliL